MGVGDGSLSIAMVLAVLPCLSRLCQHSVFLQAFGKQFRWILAGKQLYQRNWRRSLKNKKKTKNNHTQKALQRDESSNSVVKNI